MNEIDPHVLGSTLRSLVGKAKSLFFQGFAKRIEASGFDQERQMMDSRPAFGDELRNRSFRIRDLEKFEMGRLARRAEEVDVHALLFHLLTQSTGNVQNTEQGFEAGVPLLGGDTDMVQADLNGHGFETSEKKRSRHHLAVPR